MDPVQKAVDIIKSLSPDKLYAALYVLELIAFGDSKTGSEDTLALKAFAATCEEEELTLDEMAQVAEGETELKSGLGVKAEDVWKELDV